MSPQELDDAIAQLEARAIAADRAGLPHTAKSWRDHAAVLRTHSAPETIICTRDFGVRR